ncbi:MAG: HK97 family phage prohead protease [Patescibacteria group bacterium]
MNEQQKMQAPDKKQVLNHLNEIKLRSNGSFDRTKKNKDEEDFIRSVTFSSESIEVDEGLRYGVIKLSHDPKHMKLERLKKSGKVFLHHDIHTLPIGKPLNVRIENNKGKAEILFDSEDPEAMKILNKINRGFLDGISVGFQIYDLELTKEENSRGRPVYLATDWEPIEISIVGVEADILAGVGRNKKTEADMKGVLNMTEPITNENQPAGNSGNVVDFEQKLAQRMAELDSKYQRELQEQKDKFEKEKAFEESFRRELDLHCQKFPLTEEQKADVIKSKDISKARSYSLNNLTASPHTTNSNTSTNNSRQVNLISDLSDAMLYRAMPEYRDKFKFSKDSEKFRYAKLTDIAKIILERSGEDPNIFYSMDIRELVKRSINLNRFTRDINNGIADFTNITLDAINKTLRLMPEMASDDGWKDIASIVNASDFKTINAIMDSDMPKLSKNEILENEEYKNVRISDHKEVYALHTYGYRFSLSRPAIINDDLNAFQRIMLKMIRSAGKLPMELICAIIASNASMGLPAGTLFGSEHANDIDDTAPSVSCYNTMARYLAEQRGLPVDGDSNTTKTHMLNLDLGMILCTPRTYFLHRQIARSTTNPADNRTGEYNPFNGLNLIKSGSLADALTDVSGDLNYYYGLAPKEQCTTFEVAFLNGNQAPFVEEKEVTNVDGVEFIIRHDVGAQVVDFRGIVRVKYDG